MFFLISIRKTLQSKSPLLGIFAVFTLLFFSFSSFLHNHRDDVFHVKSHDDCPVSVLAHTPSIHNTGTISVVVTFLALGFVLCPIETFLTKEFLFYKSSRAPPQLS